MLFKNDLQPSYLGFEVERLLISAVPPKFEKFKFPTDSGSAPSVLRGQQNFQNYRVSQFSLDQLVMAMIRLMDVHIMIKCMKAPIFVFCLLR